MKWYALVSGSLIIPFILASSITVTGNLGISSIYGKCVYIHEYV